MSRPYQISKQQQLLHGTKAKQTLQYKSRDARAEPGFPLVKAKPLRRGAWIIGGLAVYSFTAYGFYLYKTYTQTVAASKHLQVPLDVSDRYKHTAKSFDEDVNLTEKLVGIGRLRQKLSEKAYGTVLEASAGTGRNLQYFALGKITSLTMVDQSAEMIDVAKRKFRELHPRFASINYLVQSTASPISCPSPRGFDTVIQTMGLCSTSDPADTLKTLGHLINQEHGQILLLEHGRSHYKWLNRILDDLAPAHANKHGCWWNRDIGWIIDQSGLEVTQLKRYHLGTTWWVELRAKKQLPEQPVAS
ncbi:MAG: hypothetical protein M1812_004793 [Candelaria pacifica]|nr:MAG: hypothetical protein M1812_004793 [Candelaria pacifica]